MGCSVSKAERDEEAPAALRPVKRKIEEIKRRRRGRNGSIATELLRPEDLETAEDDTVSGGDTDTVAEGKAGEEKVIEVAHPPAEEEEEEMAEKVAKEEMGRKLGSAKEGGEEEEEELPGSPSFRFYFTGTVQDSAEDSFRDGLVKKDDKGEKTKKKNHVMEDIDESSTSSEDLETKPVKKKGKGFRALTRAPSAVKSLLNVRNCYSCHSAVQERPRLIVGKAN